MAVDDLDSLSLCPHCFCCTKTIIFNSDGSWFPVEPKDPNGICGKCKEPKNGDKI